MPVANKHIFLIRALLITTSVVAGLTAGEFLLRYMGVYKSYRELVTGGDYVSPYTKQQGSWFHVYSPNAQVQINSIEFKHAVQCNQLGLDDEEWEPVKKTRTRIAILGDSFAEGTGAPRDSSYARQLQYLLDSADVMKCGVSGSDPFFSYILLKEKLATYRPDIVVMSINSSDIYETVLRGGLERFGADGKTHFSKQPPWWEPLYARSYLVRLFMHKVLGYNRFLFSPQQWQTECNRALNLLCDLTDTTAAWCRQNNSRCIFLFNPLLYEMKQDTTDCQPVVSYAQARGYEVIDLKTYMKQNGVNSNNINRYFWQQDTHNTTEGYTLFAKALKTQIENGKTD